MKKLVLPFFSLIFVTVVFSQTDSLLPPFKRFPSFPPVKLLLPDNSFFTKNDLPKKKRVMLMVFSPMCEHCLHETEEMISHIDKFKKTTIVMATMMPFDSMLSFREKYVLARYGNIIVGQDTQFFLPPFYSIANLPFLAFYDKKGRLISVFEGSLPMEKVLEELSK